MIKGKQQELAIYIDGNKLDSSRSLKLRNHASDGFLSWGYHGSGCAQTSLALLLYFGASDEEALDWYQDIKREVIASLSWEDDFEMDNSRVIDWIEAKRLIRQFENN